MHADAGGEELMMMMMMTSVQIRDAIKCTCVSEDLADGKMHYLNLKRECHFHGDSYSFQTRIYLSVRIEHVCKLTL